MLALALLLLTSTAGEPTVAERIARGRAALESLEFETAALDLSVAAGDPRATRAQRIEANLYAGIAHRVIGHDTDARLHFLWVLKNAPDTALPPDASPKIRTFYDLVRGELTPDAATQSAAPSPARTAASVNADARPSVPWLAIAGGGALVGGGAAAVLGAVPWFAHADAGAQLRAAEAAGADGAQLQREQQTQRAAWESWGQAALVVGSLTAAAGAGALAFAFVGGP